MVCIEGCIIAVYVKHNLKWTQVSNLMINFTVYHTRSYNYGCLVLFMKIANFSTRHMFEFHFLQS